MKLVREHIIFEKFIEDSDPIQDLGIGMISKIEKWIVEELSKNDDYSFKSAETGHKLERRNIIINDDLSIDVKGWVDLSSKDGMNLPKYIKFNHVYDDFVCSFDVGNYLKYMPKQVDGQIRYYMRPYPKDPEEVIKNIKKICKVKKGIKIRW